MAINEFSLLNIHSPFLVTTYRSRETADTTLRSILLSVLAFQRMSQRGERHAQMRPLLMQFA